MERTGHIRKMVLTFRDSTPIDYHLPVDDELLELKPFIGQPVQLDFLGEIHCIHCNRSIKKTFNQGYCFPCFRSLARCDSCIVKPELCHFHEGTCREPEWGQKHCLIPHTIYLANSSGLKVGITRSYQRVTRWMDQGAIEAIPVAEVESRREAGLLEVEIKKNIADKTNWRQMLKGEVPSLDLTTERDRLLKDLPTDSNWQALNDKPTRIEYPVATYPTKIKSFNFDKQPQIKSVLHGLKGQYLIFADGVINMRKFAGYKVRWQA